jgi:hypothetical protein
MSAHPDATPAGRRARGVAAYARIFEVPDDQVPAAMSSRVISLSEKPPSVLLKNPFPERYFEW